jgi:LysE type translocator
MELLILGVSMGVVGGLVPSPLHMLALAQVALKRWDRAIGVLIAPPLVIDGALLLLTFFFYEYVPRNIAHVVAYAGGAYLIFYSLYALLCMRGKSREEMAESHGLTYGSVTAASLSELSAPGTWIYWMTIAGPILAEGKQRGYWHVVPFFAGGLVGYYGAALISLALLAWGASLHRHLRQNLLWIANFLLLAFGVGYVLHAYFMG